LGRSHDNNFLNTLPYSTLIGASVVVSRLGRFPRALAAGMLARLVALTAFFRWGA